MYLVVCVFTHITLHSGRGEGGVGGGVKHSVLNMNAMLCSHYSIHVYYALLSL